ncbi:MAG: phosphodiester glycosidase family protein [Clostridia bacterium]|nr:phosphodiester glycosidase family protein [Clostridia bacterium]
MPKRCRACLLVCTFLFCLLISGVSSSIGEDEVSFVFEYTPDVEIELYDYPVMEYEFQGNKIMRRYDSDTLKFTIERFLIGRNTCYLTKVWMKEPGRQIKKENAQWGKHLALPETLAKRIDQVALVINGSGYISPVYPEIPDDYPGESKDYFYTSYGSLAITDGTILRALDGVSYTGLTLEEDGLHMYVDEEIPLILLNQPTQTWSFYDKCALIQNHESIVDRTWDFANHKATRTIIAKVNRNNYLILTATNSRGIMLTSATDFLLETFDPEWAFNLDGGPSSALLARKPTQSKVTRVFGGEKKDFDIMGFIELTGE